MLLTLDFIEQVTSVQKQAGNIALNPEAHGLDRKVKLKDLAALDYATAVDNLAEELFKRELGTLLPGSGFLGEETAALDLSNRYVWIVDPIDGTSVYSLGGEYYSSSVALVDRNGNDGQGAVIFGSVMQPARGRQFIRTPDELIVSEECDTLNANTAAKIRRPRPSDSKGFAEYLGCAFAPKRYCPEGSNLKARLEGIFDKQHVAAVKRDYAPINARPASGSSALFCCDIADGNRHFAVILFQKAWDLAVGAMYAKQAGCPVVVLDDQLDPINTNLEHAIANCTKESLINVAVFANSHVAEFVMNKLGATYEP